jgi:hypothetical protein
LTGVFEFPETKCKLCKSIKRLFSEEFVLLTKITFDFRAALEAVQRLDGLGVAEVWHGGCSLMRNGRRKLGRAPALSTS